MVRRPPTSTLTEPLFPYTTRFRSDDTCSRVTESFNRKIKPPIPSSAAMMSASMTFKRRRSGSRWGVAGSVIRHARQHDALADDRRSEEHTSELQSLMPTPYVVFCLKKTTITHYLITYTSNTQ